MKSTYILIALTLIANMSCTTEVKEETTKKKMPYSEVHRLQYHFSQPANWMNDPNGMVYLDGEFHLFYQYYPDSTIWGPMHWGHAITRDLVHWENLPTALYPDSLGYIFSGSAVIDKQNTSGLGTQENPPMVAIFTYHDPDGAKADEIDYQTQGIVSSLDKGRTWEKYAGNPVLNNPGIKDFRDPKVYWNEDAREWYMILAVKDHISIYTSPNLTDWSHGSDFGKDVGAHGGVWECPDLFTLTDQASGEEKWILFVSINPGGPNGGSATQYFIGQFDGKAFTPDDTEIRWVDWGTDNYAGVTWANVPESDGRRLFIGWMNNWDYGKVIPTEKWRGATTIVREMDLDGVQLMSKPVQELMKLRQESRTLDMTQSNWSLPDSLLEVHMQLDASIGKPFGIIFSNDRGEELEITISTDSLVVDRSRSGIADFDESFAKAHYAPVFGSLDQATIFLDVGSVEVFINGGSTVMTELFFPNEPYHDMRVSGAKESITKLEVHSLKGIWNQTENSEKAAELK